MKYLKRTKGVVSLEMCYIAEIRDQSICEPLLIILFTTDHNYIKFELYYDYSKGDNVVVLLDERNSNMKLKKDK